MTTHDDDGPEVAPTPAQQSWRDFARRRQTVWDGWIAISVILTLLGAVGMVAGVHTDGDAPIQSAWPLVFGALFVLSALVLVGTLVARALTITILETHLHPTPGSPAWSARPGQADDPS